MNCAEAAIHFDCENETLFGILARPEQAADVGIVIIVGGPQTRVGSHRQFVLLSRALAAAGYPTLRFDVRGMGDSTGDKRYFEAVTPDIGAAIDALQTACPGATRIVLWGLCDAAAAALLYCEETRDPRIAGLCLLNPWVRSPASLAKIQVKHYYGQRLLQAEFWRKLLTGRLNPIQSLAELLGKLSQATAQTEQPLGFQDRMARGWRDFPGRVLLILSGNDYTAKEFLEYTASAQSWRGLLDRPKIKQANITAADHTFSSQEWRNSVENACLDWLKQYD
ncbi:MAG: hydrolase 1, exosortase A system-associated [Rhodocyclaceae bacterium]|nr:hydrolase 1, exosortase A system-associated [Rhodocyclaceae bacterium]